MKQIRHLPRRKAFAAGVVAVVVVGMASAAWAYLTPTNDSYAQVTVATREYPFATPVSWDQPDLVPDVPTQHLVRIHNPFDFAITLNHIPAGSSQEVTGCPAASVKTAVDNAVGAQADDVETPEVNEWGVTEIVAGGTGVYALNATFDTESFPFTVESVEHPENNQDTCLSASIRVDLQGDIGYVNASS
jgi:hypothetical protein